MSQAGVDQFNTELFTTFNEPLAYVQNKKSVKRLKELKKETKKELAYCDGLSHCLDLKEEFHYKLDQVDHRVVTELFEGEIVEEAGLNAPG